MTVTVMQEKFKLIKSYLDLMSQSSFTNYAVISIEEDICSNLDSIDFIKEVAFEKNKKSKF